MPQIPVNSANITTFSWTAAINIQLRQVVFNASSTVYNGSGISNVLGIAFSLIDSVGLELMGVDWSNPQIHPNVSQTYTLDLTSLPINFLFQNYQFIGYIKDADGTVYQTSPILKAVCEPPQINESGYVPGMFQILSDCINNILTVKEFTLLVYNNQSPLSVSKSGTLYYPTGTISPVSFAGTPFSNNVVYTGRYRVVCTTVGTYDLGDNITVLITYLTDQKFPVTCGNFLGDISCCTSQVLNTYLTNCENAVGKAALQRYNSVSPFILEGLLKQNNGQDASGEVATIKKMLNCDCGASSVGQNEVTPTNPAVNSIVLIGDGGTTIPSATITGNTKTFHIASKSYVIAKGNIADLAFTITIDTSVTNVVTYKITFNYDVMAGYILTAIQNNPTWINQLNSLISAAGGIAGLNGKCVIDLSTATYAVSQAVNNATLITNITINGIIHIAPGSLFANNATTVASWLNSLTLGTFTVVVAAGIVTIQSVGNTNVISTITFTTPNIVKQFAATSATLLQVLQAIVDYLCNLTALQIALGNQLNLCTFDYNGTLVTTNYSSDTSQGTYNASVASAICNIANRINTLSSVTCATIKALFIDRPSVPFGASDRIYGTLGTDCSSLTDQQIANLVIAAVNKYSDVKTAWCAIDCTTPGTCPDVSNTNLAMSGANIGVYGLTWSLVPAASQTVTVRYRVTGTSTFTVATNALVILPNGNISGSTPYLITGLTVGTTYDVLVTNNCGGAGFLKQITTPTGSVYSGSYLLGNVLYGLCGVSPVTLYSSQPFAIGTQMFTNIGLTTEVSGFTYITIAGSNIFTINNVSGIVLSDTGSACANGTAGTYNLGNNTATVCAASPITLYTDGSFAVGKTLYTDPSLTAPKTGFSYAVFNGVIYTINSGTGAVTGTTGLSCINYTLIGGYNFSINSVSGTGIPTLPATGSGSQSGHHTAMSGNYTIILSGSLITTTIIIAYVNGVQFACQSVSAAGPYVLAITAAETDIVIIKVFTGSC